MDGPAHYRAGQQWLERAEQAHQHIEQRPSAEKEVAAATQIASAHFLAAQTALTVHQLGVSHFYGDQAWRSVTETSRR